MPRRLRCLFGAWADRIDALIAYRGAWKRLEELGGARRGLEAARGDRRRLETSKLKRQRGGVSDQDSGTVRWAAGTRLQLSLSYPVMVG